MYEIKVISYKSDDMKRMIKSEPFFRKAKLIEQFTYPECIGWTYEVYAGGMSDESFSDREMVRGLMDTFTANDYIDFFPTADQNERRRLWKKKICINTCTGQKVEYIFI